MGLHELVSSVCNGRIREDLRDMADAIGEDSELADALEAAIDCEDVSLTLEELVLVLRRAASEL